MAAPDTDPTMRCDEFVVAGRAASDPVISTPLERALVALRARARPVLRLASSRAERTS